MGILWVYPQDSLWVWDGYGDRNSVPTAALIISCLLLHRLAWNVCVSTVVCISHKPEPCRNG